MTSPRKNQHCPICGFFNKKLERHHLVPKGGPGDSSTGGVQHICHRCHKFVHQLWGKGHSYIGPTDEEEFLAQLRRQVTGSTEEPAPVFPSWHKEKKK